MNTPYIILARKYRPQNFDEVVGQEAIVSTLIQGLKTGRLAQAWLMCGPSGVGKTTLARILARCLNCTESDQVTAKPCGECPSCKGILENRSLDLLEIDGASNNRVDEVRQLQEHIGFSPQYSRYRIVLIDEVHMLSTAAFNALLKTLEEPPAHVKFIFATTEPDRILPTVRARCQRFDFFSVSASSLKKHVESVAKKEKIKLKDGVAEALASLAAGSVRNALSLLDQLGSDGKVSLDDVRQLSGQALPEHVRELCVKVWEGEAREAITLIDRLSDEAVDLKILVEQWSLYLRQALEQKIGALEHDIALPQNVTVESLIYQSKFVLNLLKDLADEATPQTAVILAVAKLAAQEDLKPLVELIDQLPQSFDGGETPASMPQSHPEPQPEPLVESYQRPDPVEEMPQPDEEIAPAVLEVVEKPQPLQTATDLTIETLIETLTNSEHRAAASFLKGAKMTISGPLVSIEVAQPFFVGMLESDINRKAVLDILKQHIKSPKFKVTGGERAAPRSEEAETAAETNTPSGAETMEKKVIDMFDGEKLN
jgi:DNA polymerase-3 subunit gamma/tau